MTDKTSDERERAGGHKTTVRKERAVVHETPDESARAIASETPKEKERAVPGKTPVGRERAKPDKAPVDEERAGSNETTERDERAASGKIPEEEKRAEKQETPKVPEGAEPREMPEEDGRAEEEESPEGHGRPPASLLRILVDLRDRQAQKSRIAFGNRLAALDRAADAGRAEEREVLDRYIARFQALEDEATKDIARIVRGWPIYAEISKVKGIGPTLGAKVLALIDISACDTCSALWRYAGYGVVEGRAERRTKGEKLHYNARLKTTLYLVGGSLLRQDSPYRAVYDEAKARYMRERPEWLRCISCGTSTAECRRPEQHRARTPSKGGWDVGRPHLAAQRVMLKLLLSHLWLRWRALEGLPTRPLYVSEYLGHVAERYPPEAFGWP